MNNDKTRQNIRGNGFEALDNKHYQTVMLERKETHEVNPTSALAFFLGTLSGPQCREMAFTHSIVVLLS